MRLSDSAAVQNGEFSDFLAAPIGEEKNGMNLSLLSAFTRLGIDPWQEAARLADLPEKSAVAALAAVITRAVGPAAGGPAPATPAVDTPSLAARLLQLLPRPGRLTPVPEIRPRRSSGGPLSVFAGVTLPPPETLRWWAIAATLLVLLVANLW